MKEPVDKNMTPRQMLEEWNKGCSNALKNKAEVCDACTRAFIDAVTPHLADTERLDFMIKNTAWINEDKADSGNAIFKCMAQGEDEDPIELSRWAISSREAIDDAMNRAAKEKGNGSN